MKQSIFSLKWLLSVVLAFVIVLGSTSFLTVWATEQESHTYENGFCSTCGSYEPAEKNTEGICEIGNAGQLYWFADQVNNGNTYINAILTDDIVVNENVLNDDGSLNGDGSNFRIWTPIGSNDENPFAATFDGNGKTVSGLYFNDSSADYVGLFGYISCSTVKNVGVIDSYIHGTFAGGVVGYIQESSITDCYNTGNISGQFQGSVGGVVGDAVEGTITNCYNTGNVSCTEADASVGGVVGFTSSGTVANCYNTGNVSCTEADASVGGVVGYIRESSITDCYNTGNVSCTRANTVVGGVVGDAVEGTITNCYNTGNVSCTVANTVVGGVVGGTYKGTITNCYNTGNISRQYQGVVGGVVGDIRESSITDCYNTGNVSCTEANTVVGGVVGDAYKGTITNCYNTGNVSCTGDCIDVGGVVGSALESSITDCYNTGNVSCTGDYIATGGVVGDNCDSIVVNCHNTGNVSGTNRVGGVVGQNYTGTVSNCYYLEGTAKGGIDSKDVAGSAESKSETQFASGEVCYHLNDKNAGTTKGIWKQTIGTDSAPTFSGGTVYLLKSGKYSNFILGDVNGDGRIGAKDIFILKKLIAGLFVPNSDEAAADINDDQKLNSLDIIALKVIIMG